MSELRIIPGGTGRSYRLWPVPEPIPPGVVCEHATHLLDLDGIDPGRADLLIDGQSLKALRSPDAATARWEWEVGFHAGVVEIGVVIDGRTCHAEVTLDPDLRKLSREAFEIMVFQALEDITAVFALSPAKLGLDRGDHRPPLARLEFLRSRMDALVLAVHRILDHPHRHLEAVDRIIPIQRATRLTAADLQRSLRYGPHLQVVNPRLPLVLRKALPSRVVVRQRRSTTDNAENRAVKAFLVRWAAWLERSAATLRSVRDEDAGMRQVWSRRCAMMAGRLRHLLEDRFFSEVSAGDEEAASGSAIFRIVPGYQEFARIRRDLGFGLAAVAGDWLDMPLARTHDLYELWVFLRVLRAGLGMTGASAVTLDGVLKAKDGSLVLPRQSLGVDVGHGLRIVFQRSYREYWTMNDRDGSFSREMVPDVALIVTDPEGGRRLVVIDAKYRVESALNDALTSIHTYRDALVHEAGDGSTDAIVQGAYLVTPYLPPDIAGDWKGTSMPNRLFHPVYRKRFRFGAVTMTPGRTTLADIQDLLKRVLADSESSLHPQFLSANLQNS